MTTRARSSRGERRSWREQDAPITQPLLYYRRTVATLLCLLFVSLFGLLIWWFWPSQATWTSKHLFIAQYDPDSAPPLAYAAKARQSLERSLPSSVDVVRAGTDANHLPDALEELSHRQEGRGRGPLLVYVAGHGCSHGDDAYLYASDFNPHDPKTRGIHVRDLLLALVKHPARETLLILDSGPLEHDLRLGTAVNRFPEILQAEVEGLKLDEDEALIVLSSHQPWERSFVSPKENWSVFGFYVAEALTSPTANADKVRFDQEKPDGKITLAEFAAHVQRGVSDWMWKASGRTRTQRPMLLVAQGPLRQKLDLVHETAQAAPERDLERIKDRLRDIVLPNLTQTAARQATAGMFRFESAAYGQETPASSAAAPASKPGEKNTDAKVVADAKGVAEEEDHRPPWLKAQAALAHQSFGGIPAGASDDWTPADYDPLSVRRNLRDMLYAQQLQIAGRSSNPPSSQERRPQQWDALQPWRQSTATYSGLRDAARIRNAALLRLDWMVSALDAAEAQADADTKVIDELQSLWDGMHSAIIRLNESLEQEEYVDARTAEGQTIDDAWSLTSAPGNVKEIVVRGNQLRDAAAALERKLQALLLAVGSLSTSGQATAHWLPRWDLAQSVPIAAWEGADLPDFEKDPGIPGLGSAPAQDVEGAGSPAGKDAQAANDAPVRAKIVLPKGSDITEVNRLLRERRTRWLKRQAALANLLPAGKDAASPIAIQGSSDQELNDTARQIADRHEQATLWLSSTLSASASPPSARADWDADRVLRLAMEADTQHLRLDRLPMPLNRVRRAEQPFLLRLEGPPGVIDLALGEDKEVEWKIRRGSDRPLDLTHARVTLAFDEALLVSKAAAGADGVSRGSGRGPTNRIRPGEYSLKELVDDRGQSVVLRIGAAREMELGEVLKPETTVKLVSVVLSLDSAATTARQARSAAEFRLPAAPFLDCIVAGYAGTLELADQDGLGGSGASQRFRLNPPPQLLVEGANAAARGRVLVNLRPMPQGETRYQLSVVNRSTTVREVVASWHVLADPRPAADWDAALRQIGDSSPQHRLKPFRLEPGKPWMIPLFPEPTPPAAGAQPMPVPEGKAPDPLLIGTGLVCQLTDVSDPKWTQWIWIKARPRHPGTYVLPDPPKYVVGQTRGTVDTLLRAAPESIDLLPSGRKTVIRGNPGSGREGRRVAFSKKEVLGELSTAPLGITAEVPPGGAGDASLVPFSLDVDGYPRALRFLVDAGTRQVAEDRAAAVQLRLLQVADPPMPGKEDALLARSQLFFPEPPKLRYELEAEFPRDAARYAVRLVRDDSVTDRLDAFYFDRDFRVECLRLPPEEVAQWNLALTCGIRELGGQLDWLSKDNGYRAPRRLMLRAEIVEVDARGMLQPLKTPVQDEVEIVLDDEPPVVMQRIAATLDWNKMKPLPVIEFTVADGDDDEGASGLKEVAWGTVKKGEDDLQDPQFLPLRSPAGGFAAKLSFTVPQKVLPAEGKSVDILLLARDRAGNRYGPEKIQTINVTLPKKKIDNPKGADGKQ